MAIRLIEIHAIPMIGMALILMITVKEILTMTTAVTIMELGNFIPYPILKMN